MIRAAHELPARPTPKGGLEENGMRNGLYSAALVMGIALALSSTSAVAQSGGVSTPISRRVERCQASVTTHNYRRSDADFNKIAAYVNQFFSTNVDVDRSVPVAQERRALVPTNAETLKITAESAQCATGKTSPDGMVTTQACTYVGCIEDLPPQFDTLPVGSTVSITVCASGVQSTSNYQRDSQGKWVMTGYRQEYVHSCTPQL
jgi:hypothetical protein